MTRCPRCATPLPRKTATDILCAGCILEEILAPPPDSAETFGSYRILCLIGEGGLGVVYLAEQTGPIRREVALNR